MLRKCLIFASLLLLPTLAQAQNIANQAGPFELTIGGSGTNDKAFRDGGFSLAGGIGWFLTPNLEIAGRDSVSYDDFGTGHSWANTVRVASDFNLNFNILQPFVGANIGYVDGTGIRGTGEAAPEAGLKFFLNSTTFLFGMAEYDFFFNHNHTTFDSGEFNYVVGLGLRF